MRVLRRHILLMAVLPLAASCVVLSIADVSQKIWLMHAVWILTAWLIALAGKFLDRRTDGRMLATVILALTLPGLAVPLLGDSSGPERWLALGPLNLYMAPLLLPAFLAACSVCLRHQRDNLAFTALIGASILLALQPDASQALALLAGTVILFWRDRADGLKSTLTVTVMALLTAWAISRPDPLEPVAYVEGVFSLALGHSVFAGLAVIASAGVLLVSLALYSRRGPAWLAALAAYYAILFACSVAGLTPAPLIGYGAGPLLGFGLLAALAARAECIEPDFRAPDEA